MVLRDAGATGRRKALAVGVMAAVGAAAAFLVMRGNPGNMGICGACFLRDTAGALGLFGKGPMVFRPELAGLVLGALVAVIARGRYAARSGSFAVTRFLLGAWMGIGALVFLGCPFRLLQRMGGGDLTAWIAALGLVGGVGVAVLFEKRGYSVGRTQVVAPAVGMVGPAVMAGLLGLFLLGSLGGPGPGETAGPPHAAWPVALGVAALAGAAMQWTGFCAISAARQVFLRPKRMLAAAGALIAGYALVAFLAGGGKVGLEGQPAAHTDHLWSILAMALVGLCGAFAGGCPVRQLVMTGEGNGDAFLTVAGIAVGGALAHNLGLASSGAGVTDGGRAAVSAGLVLVLAYATAVTAASRSEASGNPG